MPPCRKPEYQTLQISLDEARAEVAPLRVQMYRFSCSCGGSEFQRISDRFCLLLNYIQYNENQEGQEGSIPSSLTDADRPSTMRSFFKGQNNQMSIFLSFFGIPPYKFLLGNLLYLIPFFMPFTPSLNHSQCIKPLQYLSWPYFLAKFWLFWVLTVLYVG